MAPWVFAALCLACASFWAYTRAVQEATDFWGKRLGDDEFDTEMQDAIMPRAQNARVAVMFASLLALPFVGVHQLGWAIGVGGFLGSFVGASIIHAFLPKPNSSFFLKTILRGLANRRARFARASDELRVGATDAVLERLMAGVTEVSGSGTTRIARKAEMLKEAQQLVNEYGAILEKKTSLVASEATLPASKQQIKDALVALARYTKRSGGSPDSLEALKIGYGSLADFVSEGEADAVTAFENVAKAPAAELDDAEFRGLPEEFKVPAGERDEAEFRELAEKIAAAGEATSKRLSRYSEEFVRLTAEFDERVREQ
jgi:hypothetical protein